LLLQSSEHKRVNRGRESRSVAEVVNHQKRSQEQQMTATSVEENEVHIFMHAAFFLHQGQHTVKGLSTGSVGYEKIL
jgi:hypothetical protein